MYSSDVLFRFSGEAATEQWSRSQSQRGEWSLCGAARVSGQQVTHHISPCHINTYQCFRKDADFTTNDVDIVKEVIE